MAYIFRCDVCGCEETLDMPTPTELHCYCEGCDEVGCVACLPEGRCLSCIEDAEPNDR